MNAPAPTTVQMAFLPMAPNVTAVAEEELG